MNLKGIPASPGIAIGKAYLVDQDELTIPRNEISDAELPAEIARFESIVEMARAKKLVPRPGTS